MAARQEGFTLGAYRVLEQIGMGGMATVYKAYHPAMDRYVALKVLPQHYARDPRFIERFNREARTIARLEHPNILPVHDFGNQDGITYLAMRYLEGGTLKDVLALGRLTLGDAALILDQVGAALDYAHSHSVVHRDIKPANILVDAQGEAYLSDFGIAKVLEGTSDLTGGMIGTPAYMAPEQTSGKPIDGRADIYALGVILYELVTGRVPFEADTPIAIAFKHVHEPLPMPRTIDPSIPEGVERVILKVLAKNPADRYQTAGEFSAALGAALREAGADVTSTRLRQLATQVRDSLETFPMAEPKNPTTVPIEVDFSRSVFESTLIERNEPQHEEKKSSRMPLLAGPGVLVLIGAVVVGSIFLARNLGLGVEPIAKEDNTILETPVNQSPLVMSTDITNQTPPQTLDVTGTENAIAEKASLTPKTLTFQPTLVIPTNTVTSTPAPQTFIWEGQLPLDSINFIKIQDSSFATYYPHIFRANFRFQSGGPIDANRIGLPANSCGWGNGAGLASEEADLPNDRVIIIYMCSNAPFSDYFFRFRLDDGSWLEIPFTHGSQANYPLP